MSRTMTHARFSGAQRLLHWTMAAGIVAMLFIGVGMLSTVAPSYVPLLATHKTLGVALFVLVLGINLLGDGLRDAFATRSRT